MGYVELGDFDLYRISREYSRCGWEIYSLFDWQNKKVIGDQMIRSIDSVGANIAEGYGRFHYLDKNKFYYNARGSLLESKHWLNLLLERNLIDKKVFDNMIALNKQISIKLNNLITAQKLNKN